MAEPKQNTKLVVNKFQTWEIGDKYEIKKLIGSGSYGQVVQAIRKSDNLNVAIKKFDGIFDDLIDCKRILREIQILRKLKHPNLVTIIDIIKPADVKTFNSLYVVMDYCQSDLKKLFRSAIHLESLHIQTIIYYILCGLKYLHSAQVLHRDLKPANVLINEDCSIKICDFGLARPLAGIEGHENKNDEDVDAEQNDTEDDKFVLKQQCNFIKEKKEDESLKNQKQEQNKQNPKKLLQKQSGGKLGAQPRQNKMVSKALTGHVVTRWYRAPEVILLEKDYTEAIDIWSIGCIAAELQGMLKENAATFLDRSPLFPGQSCFPLSPDSQMPLKKGSFPHNSTDQLSVIFSVLGTCTEEDIQFVTDAKAIEYLQSFKKKKKDIYPGSSKEVIDFLNHTICFNPKKRLTVEQCLNHPLFEQIREKQHEIVCDKQVTLDFDDVDDITEAQLRQFFTSEINIYHK